LSRGALAHGQFALTARAAPIAIAPWLYQTPPACDPMRGIAPISFAAASPNEVVVHAAVVHASLDQGDASRKIRDAVCRR
jgi:hypothetical protein